MAHLKTTVQNNMAVQTNTRYVRVRSRKNGHVRQRCTYIYIYMYTGAQVKFKWYLLIILCCTW